VATGGTVAQRDVVHTEIASLSLYLQVPTVRYGDWSRHGMAVTALVNDTTREARAVGMWVMAEADETHVRCPQFPLPIAGVIKCVKFWHSSTWCSFLPMCASGTENWNLSGNTFGLIRTRTTPCCSTNRVPSVYCGTADGTNYPDAVRPVPLSKGSSHGSSAKASSGSWRGRALDSGYADR
jgi:hypothetical protein